MREEIGYKLLIARKKKRLSQQDVGEMIGLTSVTISNIERGVTTTTTENLVKLCDIYEIDFNEILEEYRKCT